eukprot:TRINITY_DN465_c0_g1_i1.p1 TRINITY_DN465_c0_g1~~TRINITY_DN465_c0_g1_i1.p1  ORF type:complete len:525 (+),score=160.84 TRINITY_DN465_c0_g1_i1:157-1575(+)
MASYGATDAATELGRQHSRSHLLEPTRHHPKRGALRHLLWMAGVCAFNYPYGGICATMGLVILPKEADNLYPREPAVLLGIFFVIVGVSQLVCPMAGLLSDRCRASLGRRRPYILGGCIACIISLALMWCSSRWLWPMTYAFSLFVAMIALNFMYAAQCGMVNDLVSKQEHGIASGVTACLMLAGSVSGFIFVFATASLDFRICYPVFGITLTVISAVQWCCAHEIPSIEEQPPMTTQLVLSSYVIKTSSAPNGKDFLIVFVGRTLFYVAVSAQGFMQWYLRDVIGTQSDALVREQISWIVMLAQSLAALVAVPCGQLSDIIGRKPLVYAACLVMMLTYLGFASVPLLAPHQSAFHWILFVSAFYGLGNGCYLSVDMALAMATLPSQEESAKDLGVWGIAAFIGSSIGPVLWGGVFLAFGRAADGQGYRADGYYTMLAAASMFAALAGLVIMAVRDADSERDEDADTETAGD